jgi:hypothetical protein
MSLCSLQVRNRFEFNTRRTRSGSRLSTARLLSASCYTVDVLGSEMSGIHVRFDNALPAISMEQSQS